MLILSQNRNAMVDTRTWALAVRVNLDGTYLAAVSGGEEIALYEYDDSIEGYRAATKDLRAVWRMADNGHESLNMSTWRPAGNGRKGGDAGDPAPGR